jgi:hypothetical protein
MTRPESRAEVTAALAWDFVHDLPPEERAAGMSELLDAVSAVFARRGHGGPAWVGIVRERVSDTRPPRPL